MCKLPYLVATVGELLEPIDEEENNAAGSGIASSNTNFSSGKDKVEFKNKACVVKTTARATVYLPNCGLVDPKDLKPGELIAVNKASYHVYEKLPPDYDSRVRAMELDEKPTDTYQDIGGLDKQLEELQEAVTLPITHKERFQKLGIRPPKGLLMYGPPGTGKTMMARACANQSKAAFMKIAGPSLCQMYIGDGARIVRDAFELARKKAPCIIFIDELDAVGSKRGNDSESKEPHRTMMELLNQLDGFD